MENNWTDDNGMVYVIYTYDEVMKSLDCSRPTVSKIIKELDGYIKKKRCGLGKVDLIYVNAEIFNKKLRMITLEQIYVKSQKKTSESMKMIHLKIQIMNFKKKII